jgi:ankyrin repeat protein
MRAVVVVILLLAARNGWAQPATPPGSAARAAILRALPILQQSAKTFVDKRGCVSCHHNILPILMLHAAADRGLAVDHTILESIEEKTFRELTVPTAVDDAMQGINVTDPTPNDSFLLMAAEAAGRPRDLTLEIYARRLMRWQRGDHWVTSDFRPPHSSSNFTATASAIRAIHIYMPDTLAADRDQAIARARTWLAATPPRSTEDAAFRLLGLVWADAALGASRAQSSEPVSSNPDPRLPADLSAGLSAAARRAKVEARGAKVEARSAKEGIPNPAIDAARRDLLAMQLPNGGWPQLHGYQADAYSTGEALYALTAARVTANDPDWKHGQAFLLSTQAKDGTWRVRTRMLSPADVSPPYFDVGFPYGKDAFLSYAGTAWAVMALLDALPAKNAPAPIAPSATPDRHTWLRPALFGSTSELSALLDRGLDPNTATARGTSMLMAAAADPDKVAVLLKRGARVQAQARAASGADAVTVASTYRGAAASIRLLLEAGAAPEPPGDVHVRHSPLVYASMNGDRDIVTTLLSHGAGATADALAESITFDNIDVTRALLAAGANAKATEQTGVTLLHWAVIANRPAAIPLLASAGVDINARDEAGFTALMYAATIDQGGTELVSALLAAGASRTQRNKAGRTALQQAQFLGHTVLARALR